MAVFVCAEKNLRRKTAQVNASLMLGRVRYRAYLAGKRESAASKSEYKHSGSLTVLKDLPNDTESDGNV